MKRKGRQRRDKRRSSDIQVAAVNHRPTRKTSAPTNVDDNEYGDDGRGPTLIVKTPTPTTSPDTHPTTSTNTITPAVSLKANNNISSTSTPSSQTPTAFVVPRQEKIETCTDSLGHRHRVIKRQIKAKWKEVKKTHSVVDEAVIESFDELTNNFSSRCIIDPSPVEERGKSAVIPPPSASASSKRGGGRRKRRGGGRLRNQSPTPVSPSFSWAPLRLPASLSGTTSQCSPKSGGPWLKLISESRVRRFLSFIQRLSEPATIHTLGPSSTTTFGQSTNVVTSTSGLFTCSSRLVQPQQQPWPTSSLFTSLPPPVSPTFNSRNADEGQSSIQPLQQPDTTRIDTSPLPTSAGRGRGRPGSRRGLASRRRPSYASRGRQLTSLIKPPRLVSRTGVSRELASLVTWDKELEQSRQASTIPPQTEDQLIDHQLITSASTRSTRLGVVCSTASSSSTIVVSGGETGSITTGGGEVYISSRYRNRQSRTSTCSTTTTTSGTRLPTTTVGVEDGCSPLAPSSSTASTSIDEVVVKRITIEPPHSSVAALIPPPVVVLSPALPATLRSSPASTTTASSTSRHQSTLKSSRRGRPPKPLSISYHTLLESSSSLLPVSSLLAKDDTSATSQLQPLTAQPGAKRRASHEHLASIPSTALPPRKRYKQSTAATVDHDVDKAKPPQLTATADDHKPADAVAGGIRQPRPVGRPRKRKKQEDDVPLTSVDTDHISIPEERPPVAPSSPTLSNSPADGRRSKREAAALGYASLVAATLNDGSAAPATSTTPPRSSSSIVVDVGPCTFDPSTHSPVPPTVVSEDLLPTQSPAKRRGRRPKVLANQLDGDEQQRVDSTPPQSTSTGHYPSSSSQQQRDLDLLLRDSADLASFKPTTDYILPHRLSLFPNSRMTDCLLDSILLEPPSPSTDESHNLYTLFSRLLDTPDPLQPDYRLCAPLLYLPSPESNPDFYRFIISFGASGANNVRVLFDTAFVKRLFTPSTNNPSTSRPVSSVEFPSLCLASIGWRISTSSQSDRVDQFGASLGLVDSDMAVLRLDPRCDSDSLALLDTAVECVASMWEAYAGRKSWIGRQTKLVRERYAQLRAELFPELAASLDKTMCPFKPTTSLASAVGRPPGAGSRKKADRRALDHGCEVIRCLCGFLVEADLAMLQCDHCSAWLHQPCLWWALTNKLNSSSSSSSALCRAVLASTRKARLINALSASTPPLTDAPSDDPPFYCPKCLDISDLTLSFPHALADALKSENGIDSVADLQQTSCQGQFDYWSLASPVEGHGQIRTDDFVFVNRFWFTNRHQFTSPSSTSIPSTLPPVNTAYDRVVVRIGRLFKTADNLSWFEVAFFLRPYDIVSPTTTSPLYHASELVYLHDDDARPVILPLDAAWLGPCSVLSPSNYRAGRPSHLVSHVTACRMFLFHEVEGEADDDSHLCFVCDKLAEPLTSNADFPINVRLEEVNTGFLKINTRPYCFLRMTDSNSSRRLGLSRTLSPSQLEASDRSYQVKSPLPSPSKTAVDAQPTAKQGEKLARLVDQLGSNKKHNQQLVASTPAVEQVDESRLATKRKRGRPPTKHRPPPSQQLDNQTSLVNEDEKKPVDVSTTPVDSQLIDTGAGGEAAGSLLQPIKIDHRVKPGRRANKRKAGRFGRRPPPDAELLLPSTTSTDQPLIIKPVEDIVTHPKTTDSPLLEHQPSTTGQLLIGELIIAPVTTTQHLSPISSPDSQTRSCNDAVTPCVAPVIPSLVETGHHEQVVDDASELVSTDIVVECCSAVQEVIHYRDESVCQFETPHASSNISQYQVEAINLPEDVLSTEPMRLLQSEECKINPCPPLEELSHQNLPTALSPFDSSSINHGDISPDRSTNDAKPLSPSLVVQNGSPVDGGDQKIGSSPTTPDRSTTPEVTLLSPVLSSVKEGADHNSLASVKSNSSPIQQPCLDHQALQDDDPRNSVDQSLSEQAVVDSNYLSANDLPGNPLDDVATDPVPTTSNGEPQQPADQLPANKSPSSVCSPHLIDIESCEQSSPHSTCHDDIAKPPLYPVTDVPSCEQSSPYTTRHNDQSPSSVSSISSLLHPTPTDLQPCDQPHVNCNDQSLSSVHSHSSPLPLDNNVQNCEQPSPHSNSEAEQSPSIVGSRSHPVQSYEPCATTGHDSDSDEKDQSAPHHLTNAYDSAGSSKGTPTQDELNSPASAKEVVDRCDVAQARLFLTGRQLNSQLVSDEEEGHSRSPSRNGSRRRSSSHHDHDPRVDRSKHHRRSLTPTSSGLGRSSS